MSEFGTLDQVASHLLGEISKKSTKKSHALLYAFNGTGKTRLSKMLRGESEKRTALSYDAFFEDVFSWDNDRRVLRFVDDDFCLSFIRDQGLDSAISDYFQKLTRSKIFPQIDFVNRQVSFNYSPGDDRSLERVKISRAEESIFVWSIFYVVLDSIFGILRVEKEDRETAEFNDLTLVTIDDPVSSIDDGNIITMTHDLCELIKENKETKAQFVVTTHHALFYNVFLNSFRKRESDFEFLGYLFSKTGNGYSLKKQKDDTPFSYHLSVMDEIRLAIERGALARYHFNLFRGVLEKTANFLGYSNWYECLDESHRGEIGRLVNLYSHGKLSDLESADFPDEHKEIFRTSFSRFLQDFNFRTGKEQPTI